MPETETTYLLQEQQQLQNRYTKCFYWMVFVTCLALIIFIIWSPPAQTPDTKTWVFLMFTQQWPTSYCIYWKEKNHSRECSSAANQQQWTIHGIWPTINNTDYPEYCRRIPFNATILSPIMDELDEHWPSIAKGEENKFLEHEWTKHGTCALEISAINSEYKYFSLGLQWNKQYNVTEALHNCSIVPDDSKLYSSTSINDCIKKYFGASPQLSCLNDETTGKDYIDEIRLCFDKELNLENCTDYNLNDLCDSSINYPATVANN